MSLICDVVGFVYPTYMSFKAIESGDDDTFDDRQWLVYWVVFAFLNMVEVVSPATYVPVRWTADPNSNPRPYPYPGPQHGGRHLAPWDGCSHSCVRCGGSGGHNGCWRWVGALGGASDAPGRRRGCASRELPQCLVP